MASATVTTPLKSSVSKQSSSKGRISTAAATKETCPSFRRGHVPAYSDVQRLRTLSFPHVGSFDYFLEKGLALGLSDIVPFELDLVDPKLASATGSGSGSGSGNGNGNGNGNGSEKTGTPGQVQTLKMWIENVHIGRPMKLENNISSASSSSSLSSSNGLKLTPRECRELGLMYSGPMSGDFCYQINHRTIDYETNEMMEIPGKVVRLYKKFGDMPIMVMSKACHLNEKRPEQLVTMKEEHNEFGGYFVVNGIERCVRLLQIPRRNHPMAIKRSNYKNRGPTYSDLGVAIRCARSNDDQTSITNTVHYLTTGGASLRFSGRKQEFLIPLILLLRALSWREGGNASSAGSGSGAVGSGGITDEEIYHRILQGDEENTFLKARAELLLQDAQRYTGLNTPKECISYIGSKFRMLSMKADSSPDIEIGHYIINRYILIHLNAYGDKLECLLLLLRKLYSFAAGD